MAAGELVRLTDEGLYCEAGDFFVDPWRAVPRAVITHAHSDHARRGSGRYLTAEAGRRILAARLGDEAVIDAVPYGEALTVNGVTLSLHPAGHILGSAQVRIEHRGRVCVISGDYKTDGDVTCATFEPQRCHTFISECTFGLPIYRWPPQEAIANDINRWWRANADDGKASLLLAYSLGKAQRVLARLDPSIGPILVHGAVERLNRAYRETGIRLPQTQHASSTDKAAARRALVLAPPSALASPWARRFAPFESGFVSGWMLIRGTRRRRAVGHGFVLSDHADWPGLLSAISGTGAERILLTHGQTGPMVRWLCEQGYDAASLATEFVGERDDVDVDAADGDSDAAASDEGVANGDPPV